MVRFWIAVAAVLVVLLFAASATLFRTTTLQIVIVTGSPNQAYYAAGTDYAKALGPSLRPTDVLRVLPTRGSVDNLVLLRDPKPDDDARSRLIDELTEHRIIGEDDARLLRDPKTRVVGLVQGGIADAGNASGLESLGTAFYEPLWVFRRHKEGNIPPEGINGLRGMRVAIGPNGSGTQMLASELLARHRITPGSGNLDPRDAVEALPIDAVEALSDKTVDAGFIMASWTAPSVQKLLRSPDVELVGHPQAKAYAGEDSYLHKVVLPRGAIDHASDQPREEVPLIATKASVIVQKDLPLPVQYLLLNAMKEIHGKKTVLQAAGEFPAAEATVPPLSTAAQQFYKQGVAYAVNSFLMKFLPFSVAEEIAEQIDRVTAALLLITGLSFLGALLRLVPVLYNWVRQRPVFHLLFDVLALEAELRAPGGRDNAKTIAHRLEELERRANRLLQRGVPTSLAALPLILRLHLNDLHERLLQQQ